MRRPVLSQFIVAFGFTCVLVSGAFLRSSSAVAASKKKPTATDKTAARPKSSTRAKAESWLNTSSSPSSPSAPPSSGMDNFVQQWVTDPKAHATSQSFSAAALKSSKSEPTESQFEGPLFSNTRSEYGNLPSRVYLDPDLGKAMLTSKPDMSGEDCLFNKDACLEIDENAEITRIPGVDPMEKDVFDFAPRGDGKEDLQTMTLSYTKVWVKIRKGKDGPIVAERPGWIDSRLLHAKKLNSVFQELPPEPPAKPAPPAPAPAPRPAKPVPKKKNPAECPPKLPAEQNKTDVPEARDAINKAMPSEPQLLSDAVEKLDSRVGQCRVPKALGADPKAWRESSNRQKLITSTEPNIYDKTVLKSVMSSPVPKLSKEVKDPDTGKLSYVSATHEDVTAIDTLARTIYSEMNNCIARGIQYPMAVARIALNRAELAESGKVPPHMLGSGHAEPKPMLSKVLTAPWQFSVWNQKGAANVRDLTVFMSLCPTTSESKTNWKGEVPSSLDLQNWKVALKVAADAVLFKDAFKRRTRELEGLYYYTSGYDRYQGRPRAEPSIEGRPINDKNCMYVWKGL